MELSPIGLRATFSSSAFELLNQTLLIEATGALVGFGILWLRRYLGMLVEPAWRGQFEPRLLDWAERSSVAPPLVLVRDDDRVGRGIIESRGWRIDDEELRMVRRLDEPIPTVETPNDFTIRSLDVERDLDAWCDLYVASFGARPAHIARWRALRTDPDYLPELDIVAVAPNGELAAACTCTVDNYAVHGLQVSEGRTEPVMVAEPFRRLGLARAVVAEGLRRLAGCGIGVARLTTESDNLAAHRLYESMGYQRSASALWYAPTDASGSVSEHS
jgi:ribosomal protein S18 acetylase RimI-like enzyme